MTRTPEEIQNLKYRMWRYAVERYGKPAIVPDAALAAVVGTSDGAIANNLRLRQYLLEWHEVNQLLRYYVDHLGRWPDVSGIRFWGDEFDKVFEREILPAFLKGAAENGEDAG